MLIPKINTATPISLPSPKTFFLFRRYIALIKAPDPNAAIKNPYVSAPPSKYFFAITGARSVIDVLMMLTEAKSSIRYFIGGKLNVYLKPSFSSVNTFNSFAG